MRYWQNESAVEKVGCFKVRLSYLLLSLSHRFFHAFLGLFEANGFTGHKIRIWNKHQNCKREFCFLWSWSDIAYVTTYDDYQMWLWCRIVLCFCSHFRRVKETNDDDEIIVRTFVNQQLLEIAAILDYSMDEMGRYAILLVGVFEENARLLQWLVFFSSVQRDRSTFCSFVQHHQLELRTSKTYSKRQKLVQNKKIDVQNLENIGSPLVFFTRIFFGTMRLFFGFHQRIPFVCFDILQHNGCQKNPKGLPFYIFRHCDTVKKISFLIFFRKFLNLPRVSLIFFIFCNQLEFHKVQRVPLSQFWALDIAPTLAVPCLLFFSAPQFIAEREENHDLCCVFFPNSAKTPLFTPF